MLGNIIGEDGIWTMQNVLICMVVALVLGGIVSITHKITTRTTKHFLSTLGILPLLVQVVILIINGNLGTSVAVAGAFSLIRFRSLPGNSKEIVSVFWAMAIGLALGMGYVIYAIVVTLVVAVVIIVVNKVTLGKVEEMERKLKIVIPENLDYEEVFDDIMKKYTTKSELVKVKTTNMGSMYELIYYIVLADGKKSKEFIDEIRCRNGNLLVMIERKELEMVEL